MALHVSCACTHESCTMHSAGMLSDGDSLGESACLAPLHGHRPCQVAPAHTHGRDATSSWCASAAGRQRTRGRLLVNAEVGGLLEGLAPGRWKRACCSSGVN